MRCCVILFITFTIPPIKAFSLCPYSQAINCFRNRPRLFRASRRWFTPQAYLHQVSHIWQRCFLSFIFVLVALKSLEASFPVFILVEVLHLLKLSFSSLFSPFFISCSAKFKIWPFWQRNHPPVTRKPLITLRNSKHLKLIWDRQSFDLVLDLYRKYW